MYAATENHSILTISKWERRHARPFLAMPRTADQKKPEGGARSHQPGRPALRLQYVPAHGGKNQTRQYGRCRRLQRRRDAGARRQFRRLHQPRADGRRGHDRASRQHRSVVRPRRQAHGEHDAPQLPQLLFRAGGTGADRLHSRLLPAQLAYCHLAIIDGKPARDVLPAVATAQVYFERPGGRDDVKTELPSLFNPYWQVRLLSTSAADLAAATALGGAR